MSKAATKTVTVTFSMKDAIRFRDTVEEAMDSHDNGTYMMNDLRELTGILYDAVNKAATAKTKK